MDGVLLLYQRELKRRVIDGGDGVIDQQQRQSLKLSVNDETAFATLHDRYKEDIPPPLRTAAQSQELLVALYDVALKAERQRCIFAEHHAKDVQKDVETRVKLDEERGRHIAALESRITSQEIHITENTSLRTRVMQLETDLVAVVKENTGLKERSTKQANTLALEFTDRTKRARETHLLCVNSIEDRMKVAMNDLPDDKKLIDMELFDELRTSVVKCNI